jgi:hypothetical protein
MKFVLETTLLVVIGSKLLFLRTNYISYNYVSICIDALLHLFYEIFEKPYILESYIFSIIFFFSFSHLSIYPDLFLFFVF